MKFSELIRSVFEDSELNEIKTDFEVNKLCYDSRLAGEGDVFFAIKGFQSDGNEYIKDAVSKGAKAVISDRISSRDSICIYKVNDCRKALALMSNVYFAKPSEKMKMIGVTGTNGKTTITNMIKHVLAYSGKKTGLIGTNGNFINDKFIETKHTTPESLELNELLDHMHSENVEVVAMEVSSHALALKRVFGIEFDAAIFTNLTPEHLDFHRDMEDYFNTKKILFDSMKRINVKNNRTYAIYNSDDVVGSRIVADTESERISYGFEASVFCAKNLKMTFNGMKFDIIVPANGTAVRNISIKTKLTGKFNVYNILAAAACVLNFGVSDKTFSDAITGFEPVMGRFNQLKLKNGAIAIIDYSHTPDSLLKALATIREILDSTGSSSKVITVFGCGGNRDRLKRPLMGKIATENCDLVILTSDNPRYEKPLDIIKDIETGITKNNYEVETDREKAFDKAFKLSKSGDIILLAGKGHEDYQEIEGVRHHMNDTEIAGRYC